MGGVEVLWCHGRERGEGGRNRKEGRGVRDGDEGRGASWGAIYCGGEKDFYGYLIYFSAGVVKYGEPPSILRNAIIAVGSVLLVDEMVDWTYGVNDWRELWAWCSLKACCLTPPRMRVLQ